MRAVWTERIAIAGFAVLIIGGLVWFAWPQPIPVDLAPVTKGLWKSPSMTTLRRMYATSTLFTRRSPGPFLGFRIRTAKPGFPAMSAIR